MSSLGNHGKCVQKSNIYNVDLLYVLEREKKHFGSSLLTFKSLMLNQNYIYMFTQYIHIITLVT